MNDHESLDQRLKRYYQAQKLPLDTLLDLKKTIGQDELDQAIRSQISPVKTNWISMAKSVAAFMAVVLVFALGVFSFQVYSSDQKLESVAAEIALNHAKRFNTEFSTTNIASLTTVMHLLDFAPVHPRRMQFDTYHIVGARYCTIDSAIAVQVHLEDEEQQAYTLYEFRESSDLQIEKETTVDVDGIQVTLWKEGEVIMGLAHRAD